MILQHKDYFSCVWESKVEFYLSSIRRFVNEVHYSTEHLIRSFITKVPMIVSLFSQPVLRRSAIPRLGSFQWE